MATTIETFLYENRAVHGVVEFTVSPGIVRLHLVPWAGPQVHTYAVFGDARLTYVESYPDEQKPLDPPWDVIGFDCDDLGGGRWGFCLHCDVIEWGFEATWPVVSRAGASQ
ncbi:hypothetical protein [Gemmata massiliana]|uniref:hypothetical protein n=1 Tax=Gemmata massiliana TaxID=1210884 RepID=UPI0013A6CCA8|nr:hypothetical protein [Gemmata massiliana]